MTLIATSLCLPSSPCIYTPRQTTEEPPNETWESPCFWSLSSGMVHESGMIECSPQISTSLRKHRLLVPGSIPWQDFNFCMLELDSPIYRFRWSPHTVSSASITPRASPSPSCGFAPARILSTVSSRVGGVLRACAPDESGPRAANPEIPGP